MSQVLTGLPPREALNSTEAGRSRTAQMIASVLLLSLIHI